MGIGKNIKDARERKGLLQKDLAQMVGVTPQAISNYENDTSSPKEPIIHKLLSVLEITPNQLFMGLDYNKKEAPEPEGPEAESVSIEEIEALIPLLVRAGYIRDGAQLTEEDFLFINQLLDLADTWFSRKR